MEWGDQLTIFIKGDHQVVSWNLEKMEEEEVLSGMNGGRRGAVSVLAHRRWPPCPFSLLRTLGHVAAIVSNFTRCWRVWRNFLRRHKLEPGDVLLLLLHCRRRFHLPADEKFALPAGPSSNSSSPQPRQPLAHPSDPLASALAVRIGRERQFRRGGLHCRRGKTSPWPRCSDEPWAHLFFVLGSPCAPDALTKPISVWRPDSAGTTRRRRVRAAAAAIVEGVASPLLLRFSRAPQCVRGELLTALRSSFLALPHQHAVSTVAPPCVPPPHHLIRGRAPPMP